MTFKSVNIHMGFSEPFLIRILNKRGLVYMSSKNRLQENYRADELTVKLLDAMVDATNEKRAAIHRQAIAYYANYVLGQDRVESMIIEERFSSLVPSRPQPQPVKEAIENALVDNENYIFTLKDGTVLTATLKENILRDGQLIYGCQVYERNLKPCGRYFKNINPSDVIDLKTV